MAEFPFDIVGFDLDGTLLDTHRDLGEAVNEALELGGFERIPVERVESLIGGGAKLMLKKAIDEAGGLPEDEFRPLYKALLAHYAQNNAVHTRPYSGAVETIDDLAARGVRMAVVTNKFESFATDILGKLGLADRFECVIGGDSLGRDADGQFRAKPSPDPLLEARRRCRGGSFVFVGDSSYDALAARNAGVPMVVAAYGYCDRPPQELGGDAVIDSFADLIPALQTL
ncbi:HAD family hydrolase [Qipengyuania sp. JC766]|uniref:HAD family hydrolase n=1 Tax=Qipengyuania sp. JC766 TaxID=3232139 RepID=UPI0034578570